MSDVSLYAETMPDQLPPDLKARVMSGLSNKEQVLFCLLADHRKKPNVIIVTDFNLLFTVGDGLKIRLPSEQHKQDPYVINLERVKNVRHDAQRAEVAIDYGVLTYVDALPDLLRLSFVTGGGDLAAKFCRILNQAVADARVRVRAPHLFIEPPMIGDQLAKLAALRDKGDLTQAEFEAAKKKLLS